MEWLLQEGMKLTPDRTEIHLLTPLAAGAIAVVQIVGPDALAIAEKVFCPRRYRPLSTVPAGRIVLGQFLDAAGEPFDEGLAVRGSHGKPWVEFNLHGGLRIIDRLVHRAQDFGAVLAHVPASHDHNMDAAPTQPPQPEEAGRIPPDCSSDWLRPLERWMHGCLPHAATPQVVRWLAGQPALWHARIADWLTRVERQDLRTILEEVEMLLAQAEMHGQAWRGRTVAIIGPPNVGKSTLANRLAGRPMSLVADMPGTTRDWVDEPIAVLGWPVTIMDTAGVRISLDAIEADGIARAREQAARADLRLLVLDVGDHDGHDKRILLDRLDLKRYDIVVYNKCDLPGRHANTAVGMGLAPAREVFVSCRTGKGWPDLEQAISTVCGFVALQEHKPLVFCAELRDGLIELVSILQSRQVRRVRAYLETL